MTTELQQEQTKELYLTYGTRRASSVVIYFHNGDHQELLTYASAYDRVISWWSEDNRTFSVQLYNSKGICVRNMVYPSTSILYVDVEWC